MQRPKPRFWIALGIAFIVLAIGCAAAIVNGKPGYFARSGAVVVIVGAVVATFDSIRAGNNPLLHLRRILSPERLPSETLGLVLMVLGTLVWAFGDLILRVN